MGGNMMIQGTVTIDELLDDIPDSDMEVILEAQDTLSSEDLQYTVEELAEVYHSVNQDPDAFREVVSIAGDYLAAAASRDMPGGFLERVLSIYLENGMDADLTRDVVESEYFEGKYHGAEKVESELPGRKKVDLDLDSLPSRITIESEQYRIGAEESFLLQEDSAREDEELDETHVTETSIYEERKEHFERLYENNST